MSTCGNCRHWQREDQYTFDSHVTGSLVELKTGHGACSIVRNEHELERPSAAMMLGVDADKFLTLPTFGCNQWSKRP